MGRTFGWLIVSIGLWLVFSLPTRDPAAETSAGLQPNDLKSLTERLYPGSTGSERTSVVAASVVPKAVPSPRIAAPAPNAPSWRPNRASDERAHAARSREIESEPETAGRAPEPVAVAFDSLAAGRLVVGSTVAASPASPAPALIVPGGERRQPTTARSVPVPVPVPVVRDSDTGEARAASPRPAAAPRHQTPPADTGVRRESNSLSAITAPRIMDTVRRDLAAVPQPPEAPRPAVTPGAVTQPAKAGQHAEHSTAFVAPPRPSIKVASAATAPASVVRQDKPEQTKPERAAQTVVEPPARAPVKKAPRPASPKADAVASRPDPTPRLRVTQAYAPPSYVGRVAARNSAPPAIFVPSSSGPRRSQFRGSSMWDTITRNGM